MNVLLLHVYASHLVCEESGLVGAVGCGVAASEGLHVGDSHAQNGQLVWLAGQGAAGGHHVRQLRDVRRHLVPPPPLDLTVVLPRVTTGEERGGGRRGDGCGGLGVRDVRRDENEGQMRG